MTDATVEGADVEAAKQEAVENVAERVQSWQEGAETEVVREELEKGFAEAEVEVDAADVEQLAGDIHDGEEPDTDAVDPR